MTGDTPLLNTIDSPAGLRKLAPQQLPQLAAEMRAYLIKVISQTGGHLAAGLGTVELTIALHYVFATPRDRLVWDIGHQAYPHKILTGRREQLHGIRQAGGISGFLRRDESEYDTFGAGHSSTAISAALGMAVGLAQKKAGVHDSAPGTCDGQPGTLDGQPGDSKVVAVIGDGALTAGMAFEGLNNAGAMDADLLVILNDNDMSISPNVGAISNYLARVLSGRAYTTVREGSKMVLSTLPPAKKFARRWEEHMKGMVMPGTLFEELGFYYIGPIDGHDLKTLIPTLRNMRNLKGPRFLHVVTQKGRGYHPAEGDPLAFHGVAPFDPDTGKVEAKPQAVTYTRVFSDWLCDMAAADPRLLAITPAMREGSGLVEFSRRFPERYFDAGIAEQHALTFAAGLACEGYKPVVAIYSTFLQRAYDQLIHDLSIQNLDVTFAIDRGGFVGADGPTHAGVFDLSYLRCIPGITVMAPADENECRQMLTTAYRHPGPAAVRYPRGAGPGVAVDNAMRELPLGTAEVVRDGVDIAIAAFGSCVAAAAEAGAMVNATVVNMRFIKPLDAAMVAQLARAHAVIVTVEENVTAGGAGSAVNEALAAAGLALPVVNLGLPDRHLPHGKPAEVLAQCGLDAAGIAQSARRALTAADKKPRLAMPGKRA
ncbi:MAG: 1-deoxy-D-xylulose-5-phosphate synthase [Gammaproteobacteria bacterium]|nr:1-deoxy-D-xylulose-5-phosphate synthase [Gammaproteobacteria bacterium]